MRLSPALWLFLTSGVPAAPRLPRGLPSSWQAAEPPPHRGGETLGRSFPLQGPVCRRGPGRGDWDTQAELPADAPCVHGLGASRRSLCPTFKGSPRGQLVVVVLPSLTTFVFYLAYSVFSLAEFLFKIPLSEAGFHIGVYFPCTGVPGR